MIVVNAADRFTILSVPASRCVAESSVSVTSSRSSCKSLVSLSMCSSRSTCWPFGYFAWTLWAYTLLAVCTAPVGRTWNRFLGL